MKPFLCLLLLMSLAACQGERIPDEISEHSPNPIGLEPLPEPTLEQRLALPATTSYSGVGG